MLDQSMRSDGFVAAILVGVVLATACGSLPGRAPQASAPASSTGLASPSSSPASSARLSSPSALACVPSADTRALSGPVAAYYWTSPGSTCVRVTLIDSGGQVSTVTTTTVSQYFARFICQDGNQSQPSPESGLTPGPAYSVSGNRIYWWDGRLIHWLGRDGSQGSEALDAGVQKGLEFAASPDDLRMVITTVDFSKWPLHRVTWVEDVGTHANRVVLYDADLSTDLTKLNGEGSAGWPWGWHAARPVLYDHPLCVLLGGDQFIALSYPRVVDPGTGNRLVTFPKCYGGSITAGGAFCTASFTAHSLDWYDWTGKQIQSDALPFDTESCDADLNPSGTRVLAFCQNNIYTDPAADNSTKEFLFGVGPALPGQIAQTVFLRWLDDDLVLESRTLSDPSGYRTSVTVWSLTRQSMVAGPVTIPGWYNGTAPPPTRLLT